MAYVLASDLSEDKQTDSFMGKGFEEALRKAKEQDCDLVIGEYYKNDKWSQY
jgi:hypothetical protein